MWYRWLFYLSGKCQKASFTLLVLKVLKKIPESVLSPFFTNSSASLLSTSWLHIHPSIYPPIHPSTSFPCIHLSCLHIIQCSSWTHRMANKKNIKKYVQQRHFRYPTLLQSIWIFHAFSKFSSQLSRWVIGVCNTPRCRDANAVAGGVVGEELWLIICVVLLDWRQFKFIRDLDTLFLDERVECNTVKCTACIAWYHIPALKCQGSSSHPFNTWKNWEMSNYSGISALWGGEGQVIAPPQSKSINM